MRAFELAQPATVADAVDLLARDPGATRVLAGGTDLVVGLRHGTLTPTRVVDLKRASDLQPQVQVSQDRVLVSATTPMTRLVEHSFFQRSFPALVDAMNTVGSIQIRNRATLAGNIGNASPAADTVPPMLIHDAQVVLAGPAGQRRAPLREFIVGPRRTRLEVGEIITTVELPVPRGALGTGFARMTRRRGVDLATVNLCCALHPDGTADFAYGAVGPRAFVVTDQTGVFGDPDAPTATIMAALDRLISHAAPITDIRGSAEYRLAMLRVLSRRALAAARRRLEAPSGTADPGIDPTVKEVP